MSDCPPRVKLLALFTAGERIPHLAECEDCAAFIEAAAAALEVFEDRNHLEAAIRGLIDELLANTPRHRWGVAIFGSRMLHRSVVIRDLLRRADDLYGADPRTALEFSTTAVQICDAMASNGHAPSPELRFEALKVHSSLLRETGSLDEALTVLGKAWSVADQTDKRELYRAILSLCTALIYSDPDIANFDEAIVLAESAGTVFEMCGDRRRAVIARHTKAYALAMQSRFEAAMPLLHGVLAEIAEAGGSKRDAALAHALLAMCYVCLGCYGEAVGHARTAEQLHTVCGDTVDAARAGHYAARAQAGLGEFMKVREEFTRTSDIVFRAGLFEVWCLFRLDYIAAALADDESADVRADAEAVARVALSVWTENSSQRRCFIAEACEYLRRVAIRDALTFEIADHVRSYVARSLVRRPVKFTKIRFGSNIVRFARHALAARIVVARRSHRRRRKHHQGRKGFRG